MEFTELVENLEECHDKLVEMGAHGGFVIDDNNKISVHMPLENLPVGGEVVYRKRFDSVNYPIEKQVVFGKVRFYALMKKEDAQRELFGEVAK